MPCIPLHPLLDLVQCIYIEGRWTPNQLSTDALHTATPTARSSTMHIYSRQMNPPGQLSIDALYTTTTTARSSTMHICRRQMDPHSQLSIDALYTITPTGRSRSPVNQAQMPCIPIHPLVDLDLPVN